MQIQKLNPIGYEAKTDKGNTYKKSNVAKSVLTGFAIAEGAVGYLKPDNKWVKEFSSKNLIESFGVKVSPKYRVPAEIAGMAIEILGLYGIGSWIDKQINNKRAQKADS